MHFTRAMLLGGLVNGSVLCRYHDDEKFMQWDTGKEKKSNTHKIASPHRKL